jgi:D-lactate dehydrogenase
LSKGFSSFFEFLTRGIITIHVPYTPQTHHLINVGNINLLKPTAMLINTARGPVVETKALVKALKEGKLLGALPWMFLKGKKPS